MLTKRFPVFDSDAHSNEPATLWRDCVDPQEKELVDDYYWTDEPKLFVTEQLPVTLPDWFPPAEEIEQARPPEAVLATTLNALTAEVRRGHRRPCSPDSWVSATRCTRSPWIVKDGRP